MNYSDILTVFLVLFSLLSVRHFLRNKPRYYNIVLSIFLLVTACIIYLKSDLTSFLMFMISLSVNIIAGRAIFYAKNQNVKKIIFLAALIFDVMFLLSIKASLQLFDLNIMPLGLSFITFREISFLADIYSGKVTLSKNNISDAAYISMFTQLQSGPIVKFKEFTEADMYSDGTSDNTIIYNSIKGIERYMIGFSKKVLIADTLTVITQKAFTANIDELSCQMAWLGAICYSLQLYYDFSGYSDMAIGFTQIAGFKCPENFNYPYISNSVSEFWRRWHITLGSWFKEYVYFPLGGSRVKKYRVFFNLLTVWLLTGLWHGIKPNFIVWGMIHFFMVMIEHFSGIHKTEKHSVKIIWRIVTLLTVIFAWVMFNSDSTLYGLRYWKTMFTYDNSKSPDTFRYYIQTYGWLIITAGAFAVPIYPLLEKKFSGKKSKAIYDIIHAAALIVLFSISLSLLANRNNNTFAYANF